MNNSYEKELLRRLCLWRKMRGYNWIQLARAVGRSKQWASHLKLGHLKGRWLMAQTVDAIEALPGIEDVK